MTPWLALGFIEERRQLFRAGLVGIPDPQITPSPPIDRRREVRAVAELVGALLADAKDFGDISISGAGGQPSGAAAYPVVAVVVAVVEFVVVAEVDAPP